MNEVETPARAAQRRATHIRMGLREFASALEDIAVAYQERDWIALGYESWDAYVRGEFGDERVKLSPEQREKMLPALRAASMSTRAIAAVLGTDEATIRGDIESLAITGGSSGAENPAPPRQSVMGRDGKVYPASRPRPEPEPEPEPDPEPDLATVDMRTGEVVDDEPELPEPSPAVTDYLESSENLQDARYVHSFLTTLKASGKLTLYDVGRVGSLLDTDEFALLEKHAEAIARFVELARRARSGLRVVQGGRQ